MLFTTSLLNVDVVKRVRGSLVMDVLEIVNSSVVVVNMLVGAVPSPSEGAGTSLSEVTGNAVVVGTNDVRVDFSEGESVVEIF